MTDDQPRWREFPDSLQEIFEGLWQETVSLHAHWELYLDLYGDPKKIRILNATVPSVFQLIEENLRANMIVSFGRLTDPSKTGKKDNLSLARLVESLPAHCDDDFVCSANQRLVDIQSQCEPITTHRNRRVAHNDLATAIHYHENPLPGIGQSRITEALKMIAELMNSVQMYFQNGETTYGHCIQRGTGKDLIFLLEQSIEYGRKQRDAEVAKYRTAK
jgi:hypothetical protein